MKIRDKTRQLMDQLGHEYVKDALTHALIMMVALVEIHELPDVPDKIKAICEAALKEVKK